jgi:hypothetical protein
MKLTIIVPDSQVGIDGAFRRVTLPNLGDIHAVQWDGTNGHIEYSDGTPNALISDIDDFSNIVELWNALTPPAPVPPTIAELKLAKIEAVKAERDRLIVVGGHKIGDNWYHSNEISLIQQIALNGIADKMIAAGATDGALITATPWKTLGGTFVSLTVGIAKNFIASALNQQSLMFSAAQTKITQEIPALNTVEAVNAYDVLAGFPATYKP